MSAIASTCLQCGTEFKTYAKKPGKHCSMRCRKAWHRLALRCCICGKEFTRCRSFVVTNKNCCSLECSAKAHSHRVSMECAACGKPFTTALSTQGKRKYCSKECAKTAHVLVPVTCVVCNAEFMVIPSRSSSAKVCSPSCHTELRRKLALKREEKIRQGLVKRKCGRRDPSTYAQRVPVRCEGCGSIFMVAPHRASQTKTCSWGCRLKRNNDSALKRRLDIRGRLTQALWVQLREQILERDGRKCSRCGSDSRLTVHHKTPWRDSRDDSPSNLITLCRYCHRVVEWGTNLRAKRVVTP